MIPPWFEDVSNVVVLLAISCEQFNAIFRTTKLASRKVNTTRMDHISKWNKSFSILGFRQEQGHSEHRACSERWTRRLSGKCQNTLSGFPSNRKEPGVFSSSLARISNGVCVLEDRRRPGKSQNPLEIPILQTRRTSSFQRHSIRDAVRRPIVLRPC